MNFMNRTLFAGLWAAFVLSGSPARAGDPPPPTTVPRVDLARYVGTWHEIAKIPNRFQKKCVRGTTATYTLREDGTLEVVNACFKEDGELQRAKGVAKIEDPETNARLKVSFVKALGVRLFWGDYWIIGLGEDYEYALVGHPKRKYGWILSRTPVLPPGVLEDIHAQLRAQGYDPADFETTAH